MNEARKHGGKREGAGKPALLPSGAMLPLSVKVDAGRRKIYAKLTRDKRERIQQALRERFDSLINEELVV